MVEVQIRHGTTYGPSALPPTPHLRKKMIEKLHMFLIKVWKIRSDHYIFLTIKLKSFQIVSRLSNEFLKICVWNDHVYSGETSFSSGSSSPSPHGLQELLMYFIMGSVFSAPL